MNARIPGVPRVPECVRKLMNLVSIPPGDQRGRRSRVVAALPLPVDEMEF